MMEFTLSAEPPYFDDKVRHPGRSHLIANPLKTSEFYSYWRECADDLKIAFTSLCAYSAIKVDKGDVDHFVSQSESCKLGQKELIYEWSNYRYSDPPVNQSKHKAKSTDLLDPLLVKSEWFEVDIPSGLLHITDLLTDDSLKKKAQYTIEKLKLNQKYVRDRRLEVYTDFRDGDINLRHVKKRCPLVERAIRIRLDSIVIQSYNQTYTRLLEGTATLCELEQHSPELFAVVKNKIVEPVRRIR